MSPSDTPPVADASPPLTEADAHSPVPRADTSPPVTEGRPLQANPVTVPQWVLDMEDASMASIKGSAGWYNGTHPEARNAPVHLPICQGCSHTVHSGACLGTVILMPVAGYRSKAEAVGCDCRRRTGENAEDASSLGIHPG